MKQSQLVWIHKRVFNLGLVFIFILVAYYLVRGTVPPIGGIPTEDRLLSPLFLLVSSGISFIVTATSWIVAQNNTNLRWRIVKFLRDLFVKPTWAIAILVGMLALNLAFLYHWSTTWQTELSNGTGEKIVIYQVEDLLGKVVLELKKDEKKSYIFPKKNLTLYAESLQSRQRFVASQPFIGDTIRPEYIVFRKDTAVASTTTDSLSPTTSADRIEASPPVTEKFSQEAVSPTLPAKATNTTVIQGKVSYQGAPVPGVEIWINAFSQYRDTTDNNGDYRLTLKGEDALQIRNSLYFLIGVKSGYERIKREVYIPGYQSTLNLNLQIKPQTNI